MEAAQWIQLAVAVVAVLALSWNAYQTLNRRAVAYGRASNLLSLAKSLDDLDSDSLGEREQEERQVMRERLAETGLFYTQLYISSVRPWVDYMVPTIALMGAVVSLATVPGSRPITGSYDDGASVIAAVAPAAMYLAVAFLMWQRVERNKKVERDIRIPAHLFYPKAEPKRAARVSHLHALLAQAHVPTAETEREA